MKLLLLQTTVFLGLYFPLATKATSAQFPSRPTVEDEETLHGSLRTRELKKTAAPTPPGKALKPAAPAPTPKPTKAPKPAPAPKPTKAPKPNGKTPGGGTSTSNTDRAVYNPGDCIPFKNVPQHVLDSTLAKSTNISDKDRKEGFDEASYTVCLVENGCNTGGCRYYNWLVCDKVGALPWLRFVCNDGFATPPPVIPISTTNIPIRSDNTTGGVIFGLDGSIIPPLVVADRSQLGPNACVKVDTTAQQAAWTSAGYDYKACQYSSDCTIAGTCCSEAMCACLPLNTTTKRGNCV